MKMSAFIHPVLQQRVKLGRTVVRRNARSRTRASLMRNFLEQLPDAPMSFDNTNGLTSWGMMDNDRLGDCTIAGPGHLIQAWTRAAGDMVTVPDATIVQAYCDWDGYIVGDPNSDQGGDILTVCQEWKSHGLGGHFISAHAEVNMTQMRWEQALWLFGGLNAGINLPLTAQAQVGQTWDIVDNAQAADAQPGTWGGHCLIPGTRLLTADLRWVPIEKLQAGDRLVGFDEERVGPRRNFKTSLVESSEIVELPCYRIEFEDGSVLTASSKHRWLIKTDGVAKWRETEKIRSGVEVFKPFEVWEENTSREAGYLAAAFDGEGWLGSGGVDRGIHRLGFAQRDNAMLREVERGLKELGFTYGKSLDSGNGFGITPIYQLRLSHRANLLRFLGSIRPHRLLERFTPDHIGCLTECPKVKVANIESVGKKDVVALQTSSRTYIAEGFASHNCVAVVGYDPDGVTLVTWGALQRATWRFVMFYFDEAHAIISPDWPGQPSVTADALLNDLQAVGN